MDPKGSWWLAIGAIVVLVVSGAIVYSGQKSGPGPALPTPSPAATAQLPADKQPQVELEFSRDGHYVTVNIASLHADKLEYNLIYDASVKTNRINTGVNAAADIAGKSTYSYRQLLGSESSGKFTYHENIANALMELTLRDASSRSIFTATYPFAVTAGRSIGLTPSQ